MEQNKINIEMSKGNGSVHVIVNYDKKNPLTFVVTPVGFGFHETWNETGAFVGLINLISHAPVMFDALKKALYAIDIEKYPAEFDLIKDTIAEIENNTLNNV